jgi:hypothetical protein
MNIEELNLGFVVDVEFADEESRKLFYDGRFSAVIVDISNGKIRVEDEEGNDFVVTSEEILEIISEEDDSDHDGFRNDVEADADALASAGFGEDECYEHGSFDEAGGD